MTSLNSPFPCGIREKRLPIVLGARPGAESKTSAISVIWMHAVFINARTGWSKDCFTKEIKCLPAFFVFRVTVWASLQIPPSSGMVVIFIKYFV